MVIRNFDFPSVTLRQVFESQELGRVPELGVLCVGPQYRLHTVRGAADDPLIATSATYSPKGGLTAVLPGVGSDTIPDLDLDHVRLVVRNGIFKYAHVTGTLEGNTVSLSVAVMSGRGSQASPEDFGTRGVKVGDPIYVTNNGEFTGDLSRVVRIEFSEGSGYNKVVLDRVPSELSGPVQVDFCVYSDAEFDGDSGYFSTKGPDQIVIKGAIKTAVPELGKQGDLQAGEFLVEYRERVLSQINRLGSVSNAADLKEQLGEPCAENPLALACLFALLASNGDIVYYTAVRDDSADSYAAALESTDKYTGIYSVVPCSENPEVVKRCTALCESISKNKESTVRRVIWFGITQDECPTVMQGRADWNQSSRTLAFEPSNGESGTFRAGDVIRFAGQDTLFKIESFDGLHTYTLANALGLPDTGSVQAELVRVNPTPSDIVANVISKKSVQTERAVAVWADGLVFNGERLPNYPLAAAAAGMRSYEPVHRPLSNLPYQFFGLAEPNGLSTGMLRQIGAQGIWIIGTDSSSFVPVNRRQVTTAASNDVNRDEESVIANIDSIAMQVALVGRNLVGSSNISPALITLLSDSISSVLDSCLVNRTDSAVIGPQLISWELRKIWQDPVSLDRIYADITVTPPKPFNQFDMTMRVI